MQNYNQFLLFKGFSFQKCTTDYLIWIARLDFSAFWYLNSSDQYKKVFSKWQFPLSLVNYKLQNAYEDRVTVNTSATYQKEANLSGSNCNKNNVQNAEFTIFLFFNNSVEEKE